MAVTLFGIVMLFRAVHAEKALLPMVVTEAGMVTLARLVQFEKALSGITPTPSGIAGATRERPCSDGTEAAGEAGADKSGATSESHSFDTGNTL